MDSTVGGDSPGHMFPSVVRSLSAVERSCLLAIGFVHTVASTFVYSSSSAP